MRLILSAVAAIAGLVLLTGAMSSHKVAEAATVTIQGTATGAEENPPVTEGVTARVRLVFDDVTNDVAFSVTVNGISQDQITAAHIHRGARGVNGPVIYPLSLEPFSQVSGTVRLNASDVPDLRAGNLYFNVHSKTNAGGTARMQIILPASATAAAPTAPTTPVTPPSTGDAGLLGDTSSSLMFVAGILTFALSGAGVLSLARKRA